MVSYKLQYGTDWFDVLYKELSRPLDTSETHISLFGFCAALTGPGGHQGTGVKPLCQSPSALSTSPQHCVLAMPRRDRSHFAAHPVPDPEPLSPAGAGRRPLRQRRRRGECIPAGPRRGGRGRRARRPHVPEGSGRSGCSRPGGRTGVASC